MPASSCNLQKLVPLDSEITFQSICSKVTVLPRLHPKIPGVSQSGSGKPTIPPPTRGQQPYALMVIDKWHIFCLLSGNSRQHTGIQKISSNSKQSLTFREIVMLYFFQPYFFPFIPVIFEVKKCLYTKLNVMYIVWWGVFVCLKVRHMLRSDLSRVL